jgi:uncharacterized protein YerC
MTDLSFQNIWDQPQPAQLLRALIETAPTAAFPVFLRDVLTEKEIIEIAARFEAARLLSNGGSYKTIQEQTKLSTRTIARISLWLSKDSGVYRAALDSLNNAQANHSHISPARAD